VTATPETVVSFLSVFPRNKIWTQSDNPEVTNPAEVQDGDIWRDGNDIYMRFARDDAGSVWIDWHVGGIKADDVIAKIDTALGNAFWRTRHGLSINWLVENWTTATEYNINDALHYAGNAYICIQAHTSGSESEPNSGGSWTDYWDLLASQGATGPGSGDLLAANNLSEIASPAGARVNLGLGAAATAGFLDEDDFVSDSATAAPSQQSAKAYIESYADGKILDEDDFSTDSATQAPSQQSTKAYIDSQILDEDDFATDSATKAPSQQSTKAYLTARLARGDAAQSLSETYKAQIRANAETASFAAMAHANALVNPSMAVSQEHGGSAVAPGNYAADQWIGSHGTTGGFAATFQRITDGSLPHSPHYIRMLVTSPAPSPGWLTLYQPLEGTRLANFECGTASAGEATVGVWMRSSVVGAQLSPVIKDPTAAHSASTTFTIASANTWEWHTGVISLPTTGTWPRDITRGGIFDLYHPPTGSPIYNVSGATLDVSSPILLRGRHTITANMSKSLLRPYGEELNICQWYWRSSYPIGTQPGTVTSSQLGRTVEGTQPYVTIGHVDIVMRVNNPTVTVYSPNSGTSGKAYANSGADVNAIGAASGNIINFYVNNVSVSAGTGISVHFVANARM
jgi:hypothetical protein